jgi:hypothetical protein
MQNIILHIIKNKRIIIGNLQYFITFVQHFSSLEIIYLQLSDRSRYRFYEYYQDLAKKLS